MRDEDIDFSDAPELGSDFFANAILWPGPKKQITLRLDPDVLTFFRKHGPGTRPQSTLSAQVHGSKEGAGRIVDLAPAGKRCVVARCANIWGARKERQRASAAN